MQHKRLNVRTISKSPFDVHTGPIFKKLNILPLHNIYLAQIGKIMFQYKAGLLPTCFENIFLLRSQIHVHNTRNANYFSLPKWKTNIRLFSFQYQGPKFFNSLSHEIQNSPNIASFKHKLKLFLLSKKFSVSCMCNVSVYVVFRHYSQINLGMNSFFVEEAQFI